MGSVLLYLREAFLATIIQIGIFIVPGLILAFIMNYVAGFVERRAIGTMGRGWYLGLFGWLGTSIHELGHAIFCLLFRHKITKMKLFDPDPETGILGYVEHSYNSRSIYQIAGNFFIGIGPILLGTATIYLLSYLLLSINPFDLADSFQTTSSGIQSWSEFWQLLQILLNSSLSLLASVFSWQHLSSWQLYFFIYLVFTIGSSITLSPPDIKSTLKGFGVILVLIFIFNLATVWSGLDSRIISGSVSYLRVFYTAMLLILILNILAGVIIILPLSLLRIGRSKAE